MKSGYMAFGNAIKVALEENGMTQTELARLSGISRPALNNIIKNKVSPGLDTLEKIAKPLGITVQDILNSGKIYDGNKKEPKEDFEYELELMQYDVSYLRKEVELLRKITEQSGIKLPPINDIYKRVLLSVDDSIFYILRISKKQIEESSQQTIENLIHIADFLKISAIELFSSPKKTEKELSMFVKEREVSIMEKLSLSIKKDRIKTLKKEIEELKNNVNYLQSK